MSPSPRPTRARPKLVRTLLRLFTVQGSWNYERMQGIGVGVAEEPLLRDLRAEGGSDGVAYRTAVARGAHFFNAHPYLCGLAVGAAARAEHDGVPPEQVERLRTALCGPLGSLGDRLVWAGWLPFTSAPMERAWHRRCVNLCCSARRRCPVPRWRWSSGRRCRSSRST